jgi:DnaK suppressor protein
MAKATTRAANRSSKTAKKAATKATTKSTASRKSGSPATKAKANGLDKFQESQLQALEEERATYLRQAESLQAEADSLTEDREPGDVQFDEESGEGDTLAVERERDLALSAQARAAIEEIDRAIVKIREGNYGSCDVCGTTIPKERLKALPYAALCVKCKSGGLGLQR